MKPPQLKGTDHTKPWRCYVFRVHCTVTARWMKIRVPYGWFWQGTDEYGEPEVEAGTIASLPTAEDAPIIGSGPRAPRGQRLPGMPEKTLEQLEQELASVKDQLSQMGGRLESHTLGGG